MDLAVVRLLVACGAAVNCHDKRNGYTPLHYACQRGERETAALLLDSGANLHAVTSFGYTALMCACNCSRADEALVAMLFAAEYDVRFIEASAKADVNVTEAFQAIAQQVIDRIPRGASRPASRQLSSKKSSKKGCSC